MATLTIYLDGKPQWLAISLVRIAPALLGLGFCYLIHLLLRNRRLKTTKSRLIALALVAPVLAEIFAWANYFAVAAVDPSASLEGLNWAAAIRTVLHRVIAAARAQLAVEKGDHLGHWSLLLDGSIASILKLVNMVFAAMSATHTNYE